MLEMAIVENIQRENLDPIEVAMSYQRLIDECQLTQEEMADRVGKKRTSVTNSLRLLKLPVKVQHDLKVGLLSVGHAKVLLGIDKPEVQEQLCDLVVKEHLSVRQLEERISRMSSKTSKSSKDSSDNLNDGYNRLRECLSKCCNPVQNLEGDGWAACITSVDLIWNAPEAGSTGDLLGYNVYRDAAKINEELVTMCEFHDMEVEPFETYSYYVEAVYDDGCSSESDPIEVTVDQGVGVVENSNVQVKVFPNPSEGFVNVAAEGLQDITLIDMMGRIVSQKATSQPTETVDLTNLSSGLYLLRVTTEMGVALQRVEVK